LDHIEVLRLIFIAIKLMLLLVSIRDVDRTTRGMNIIDSCYPLDGCRIIYCRLVQRNQLLLRVVLAHLVRAKAMLLVMLLPTSSSNQDGTSMP
jgi:hypothetical protein